VLTRHQVAAILKMPFNTALEHSPFTRRKQHDQFEAEETEGRRSELRRTCCSKPRSRRR